MAILDTLRSFRTRRSQHAASFILRYVPDEGVSATVGRLDFDGTFWTFEYDDDYKRRRDLRPVEGFGDLDRVYRSSVLFPFFAVRIPDVDRGDVRRLLNEQRILDPDPSDLLRLFGRKVVSSPAFELLPA